ncbi:MAG TPA: hypothetical protein ENH00_02685 [Actinobacteria bacterium]|nr:hypothetical protein [Actinomycetota bacterium]HDK45595.1 hypothetical protein [Actinomycetota bacterium]HDL48789.1 hypothetical protein [Actinomycetota bacterium]
MTDLFCSRCAAPAMVVTGDKALCSACAAASVSDAKPPDRETGTPDIRILFLDRGRRARAMPETGEEPRHPPDEQQDAAGTESPCGVSPSE